MTAPPSPNLGARMLTVADPDGDASFPVALFCPTAAPEKPQTVGGYPLAFAPDAEPTGTALPLVAVSHGSGGTPWTHCDLARALALAGFAVALPEHLGNSVSDNALDHTVALLTTRSRQCSRAIDAAFADPLLGPHLRPGRVGVVGHSIGGCTALTLAGGHPWPGPYEGLAEPAGRLDSATDERVAAIVLLAPATHWFMPPGALAGVRVPILLWTGTRDAITTSWHADVVRNGVPDPALVQSIATEGAGHFSCLSPFPPERTGPAFPPSQDPPGFDRAGFLPGLFAEIVQFLWATLAD